MHITAILLLPLLAVALPTEAPATSNTTILLSTRGYNDPDPEPTDPRWADIKTTPGAIGICTERNYQGHCEYLYDETRFGVCATLWDPFKKNIKSLAVPKGGQCVFWDGAACSGKNRALFRAKHRPYAAFDLTRKDHARLIRPMSFSCWGHTNNLKGIDEYAPVF